MYIEFLAGLSSDLDKVQRLLLGKEPLPSTKEVFSYVRREENRKNIMMGGSSAENSTLSLLHHKLYWLVE